MTPRLALPAQLVEIKFVAKMELGAQTEAVEARGSSGQTSALKHETAIDERTA